MHRTSPGRHRASDESTLVVAEQMHPEWRPWLRLLRSALAELGDSGWVVDVTLAPVRAEAAPLLHDAVIALRERRAREWIEALFSAAVEATRADGSPLEHLAIERLHPLALLEAAIQLDQRGIAEVAGAASADPDALGSVAQLAAMPVLHACRRHLAREVPPGWRAGYCPVCGAWPALVEMRGLERERRLRCGRCACDWRISVLRCPFCGETDHKRLGGLLPEGEEERRRIDTCQTCRGYVKAVTTLMALPEPQIAAEDVATLHLDLAAVERGYGRPSRPGHEITVRVVAGLESGLGTGDSGFVTAPRDDLLAQRSFPSPEPRAPSPDPRSDD